MSVRCVATEVSRHFGTVPSVEPGNLLISSDGCLKSIECTMVSKFLNCLIVIVLCCGYGFAQQKIDYRTLWQNGEYEKLHHLLPDLLQRYPNNDEVDYLEALLETDGKLALKKWQDFVRKNPHSVFVPEAQFRIAQYAYAQGTYIGAKEKFIDIVRRFPSSETAEGAIYYSARCWAAVGSLDSAKQVLKVFLRVYSNSKYATWAKLDLQQINGNGNDEQLLQQSTKNRSYVVQIGAFSLLKNALICRDDFLKKGHSAKVQTKIVNGRKYYVVWVGEFSTAAEAQKFGRHLEVPFQVVEKTNLSN
ncbi:hypothetical protein DRP98_06020 [candidate division KSB1 bacterium]|nr:MAG: hypothetical protein DRP98_06020 [candidate division KSB1 bacterium]